METNSDLVVGNNRYVVVWTLEDLQLGDKRQSPTFKHQNLNLWLEFEFQDDAHGYSYLDIECASKEKPLFEVILFLFNGVDTVTFINRGITNKDEGYRKGLKADILKHTPEFLNHHSLSFKIIFRCLSHFAEEQVASGDVINQPAYSSLEALSNDFKKLFDEDSNQDVELTCAGQVFKAHKYILSVRSEVLASMLKSNMVEGKTATVEFDHMTPSTFQQFLLFLYTGKLPELTVELAKELFVAGDLYVVDELKRQCSRFLFNNLTLDNACDILAFADQHVYEELKENVIVYIVKHDMPVDDERWTDFCERHSKLAIEVLNRICLVLRSK